MPSSRDVALASAPGGGGVDSLVAAVVRGAGTEALGGDAREGSPLPSALAPTRLVALANSLLSREAPKPRSSIIEEVAAPASAGLGPLPVRTASIPDFAGGAPDLERLRRGAHELLETLLGALVPKASTEDRVPLVRAAASVQAGQRASATLRIASDDGSAIEVMPYCSNFVSDSGFEIPSLRVTVSPRMATIPPKGELTFAIEVSVPEQAPAGVYSGLIQAAGTKYVKAVLSVEVK
jgi:hypothetical protein